MTMMAEKSNGHNFSIPEEEEDAIDAIKDMIDELFRGSLIQFSEDQLEVYAAKERILNCSVDARNHHDNFIIPEEDEANRARVEHKQCRIRENNIIANTSQECASYHSYRKNPDNFDPPLDCMATALTWDKIKTDDYDAKHSMEECLVLTVETLEPLYHEYLGCKESNDLRKNVSEECHRKQTNFEDDFCDYAYKLKSKCHTRANCVDRETARRSATHAWVEKAEAARKADWKTGTHILCLLQVFERDNANKTAQLNECAWAEVDTSNITIVYPDVPPVPPCPVEETWPCNDTWLETEYRSQDWYNSSTINTCTACRASGPTPAPTPAPPTPAPTPPTPAPTPAPPNPDFESRPGPSGSCANYEDTLPGDPLHGSSHTIVMALQFHSNNVARRQWIFNIGQESTGANHWLYNQNQGSDNIQFGAWSGVQIHRADISGASTLATTFDAETKAYKLYVNGNLASSETRPESMNMNINSGRMLVGKVPQGFRGSESDFQGCVQGVNVYREALTDSQVADASSHISEQV